MDSESVTNIRDEILENSTNSELPCGNNGATVEGSTEKLSRLVENDKLARDSSCAEATVSEGDEPYIGQEFESEAAAHAFYSAYGVKMGFIIRVSNLSRSRRDGSIITRTLVCNKEGYRESDKRSRQSIRQRPPTRVGCKALLTIKKQNSGRWVITKFVKEHNHDLSPGKCQKGLIYDQYPDEQMKIQELTHQLTVERKRSASYRKIIDLLFNHIEEHTHHLSGKIQYIVDSVKEIESEGKGHRRSR